MGIENDQRNQRKNELSATQKKLASTVLGQIQSGRVALEYTYTGGVKDTSAAAAFTATTDALVQFESIAATSDENESEPQQQFEVRGRTFRQANLQGEDKDEVFSYSLGKSNIITATGPRHRQLLYATMQAGTKESKRPAIEININPGALRDPNTPGSPLNTVGAMMKGANTNLSMYAWPTESGLRGKFKIEGGFISKMAFISMIGAAANGR